MRAKKNLEAANNELEVNLDNALKVTTSLNHFLVQFFIFLLTVFVSLILRVCFNSLSSKLNIQFLQTGFNTFIEKMVERICLNIKAYFL